VQAKGLHSLRPIERSGASARLRIKCGEGPVERSLVKCIQMGIGSFVMRSPFRESCFSNCTLAKQEQRPEAELQAVGDARGLRLRLRRW